MVNCICATSYLELDILYMREIPELLLTEGISRVKRSTQVILSNSFSDCQPIATYTF